ncbi:DUF2778 domain-containing protein [Salmonella enterica]|uniref:DUF2778 domain-containing protein n=1 Tax=Salmonella enterica TaxID=28901 RepID=UPI000FB91005|nr:DUF2778 domain-containing protein [Salmonella enterica]ECI5660005.1 DUF2778 domain-containing protein [Salmonella enterica subsp. diarizonae]EDM5199660.1 DUF2778 domain-containing protein [Salmonella enterica]EJM5006291.1 DUF2778 domain-containing protein [Salmonella enterica]EKK6346360.1 DUF2778 domain-containing protein [Salmonella enterica]
MALNGKMLLNGADIAPLSFPGVGTFMAFSGNGAYKNRGGCGKFSGTAAGDGPLPEGRYWIVSRGGGGSISKGIAYIKDTYNKFHSGAEFRRDEWFALYPNDWNINDTLWIEGVKRQHFRLHPGVLSDGCITLVSNADFHTLRNALLATQQIDAPCMKDLKAYGMIEVVNNGYNTCS